MQRTTRKRFVLNLFANQFKRVAVFLVVLCVPVFASVGRIGSFDAALKKKVVYFGPSPYYPGGNVRVKLSCYFYPTFMVKEFDEGQKGAEWLAIVPIEKRMAECAQPHAPGERVIEKAEWSGYFKGAKGNLVFFDDADGTNRGLPFVVYDSRTGRKIFEDSAYDSRIEDKNVGTSLFNRLQVSSAQGRPVSLRYLRVVEADCDLHREKASCWEQVKRKFELKTPQMPFCRGYEHIPSRWESAVAYPVEVFLFPQPTIKTIAGPVKCWPVD